MAVKRDFDLAQVERLAAQGLTQQQIADALGISRATVQRRIKADAAFDAAVKKGAAKGIALVANKLFEAAKEGNIAAAIFFLKARAGWRDRPGDLVDDAAPPTPVKVVVSVKDARKRGDNAEP